MCVCVGVRVVSVLCIFVFVLLHGCVSILTFPHGVGKWEVESRETSCWIHTICKTRRKRAGLTLRSTWRLGRQLWYQPSFLYWLIVAGKIQPTRIWIKNCHVCMLDILTIPKPEEVGASLAVKMWVSLMPNIHRLCRLEIKILYCVLYIRNNSACFVWSSC